MDEPLFVITCYEDEDNPIVICKNTASAAWAEVGKQFFKLKKVNFCFLCLVHMIFLGNYRERYIHPIEWSRNVWICSSHDCKDHSRYAGSRKVFELSKTTICSSICKD
jgi:hypothetical protein